ncbi:MAG: hypothetical protein KDJ26_08225 [Alphaproteobacteria bacterium]|nr:hypothetical protein [Alphaproteobacteria bacterium]MCB9984672.1 hypothetical protein [Micavibrio sp.]HPQ50363.1 hypothetical protein [Alphaproteobacteria bacterium]HRK98004.1 hypothetical protein [Alphaproteobacteria bacterium]
MTKDKDAHYNLAPKRKADFHTPPNHLKMKVGYGGLSENILEKAQALLENNTADFRPLGEMYLESMMRGVAAVKALPEGKTNDERLISAILFPTMQLKANGGMFHYSLVTQISDRLIQFLEVVDEVDQEAIEIIMAFHTTVRAILLGQIRGDGGQRGKDLLNALIDACYRYFEKYPEKKPR